MKLSTTLGTLMVRTSDLKVLESSHALDNLWMLEKDGYRQVKTSCTHQSPRGPDATPPLIINNWPRKCSAAAQVAATGKGYRVLPCVGHSHVICRATVGASTGRACGASCTGTSMKRSKRFKKRSRGGIAPLSGGSVRRPRASLPPPAPPPTLLNPPLGEF